MKIEIDTDAALEITRQCLEEDYKDYCELNDSAAWYGSPEEIRELRDAFRLVLQYYTVPGESLL